MQQNVQSKAIRPIPGAAKKYPLKLFSVFAATARNFSVEFSTGLCDCPIYSYLVAKRHLIVFKYEFIDFLV